MSTTEPTTLAEYLSNGGDPSKLKGYGSMLDDLVGMLDAGLTAEDRAHRVAFHRWEPFGEDHVPGPFGAWASIDEYRAYCEQCVELAESDNVREQFMAAMPAADRLEVERRVWELQQPLHQVDRERGGGVESCTTCNGGIGADDDYVRIRERFEDPSGDDVVMCLACIRSVVPEPVPALN